MSAFTNTSDGRKYFAATERHEPTGAFVTLVVEAGFLGRLKDFRKAVARFVWSPDADPNEVHNSIVASLFILSTHVLVKPWRKAKDPRWSVHAATARWSGRPFPSTSLVSAEVSRARHRPER